MFKDYRIPILIIVILSIEIIVSCDNRSLSTEVDNGEPEPIEEYISMAKNKGKHKDERDRYLNKALELYSELDDNEYKRKKISQISTIFFSEKKYEMAESLNKEMLRLSLKINDSFGIAKSYNNFGIYSRQKTFLDSAYRYFQQANKIYNSFDKKGLDPDEYSFSHGSVLIELAKLSRKVKNYIESEELTTKAIKKFELSGDHRFIPLSYSNLGIIAKYLGRYEDAVEYHEKAIEYTENTEKSVFYKIISYNNIGTVYKSKGDYKKSEEYYLKALSFNDFLSKKPKRRARLLNNLGYVKFLANKEDKTVLKLFDEAYSIRDSINDIINISTSNLHYAEYYQSFGNDVLSKNYALKVENDSPIVKDNDELLRTYQILSEVSENEKGLAYAQKYIKLSDSLVKEERLFRDKFARIRFETEEKEQQIVEKDQQIVHVQNQNTIYLLGMLLLLSGIGFAIYFFRQRTKYLAQQNQIVQFQASYETETRISKRLHDELGNDIFQVMLQYQNDPHDPQIKDKLNTTYHKARDISRENNEFDTDETFAEELRNMLQNYSKNGIQLMVRGLDKIQWDLKEKPVKITVYRVLQELMTNMQKHSKASLVVLVFSNVDQIMQIKYSDNGIGIAKEQLKSKNGLRNTEKRIGAIGGTLIFESEKEKGFKAEIKIPN